MFRTEVPELISKGFFKLFVRELVRLTISLVSLGSVMLIRACIPPLIAPRTTAAIASGVADVAPTVAASSRRLLNVATVSTLGLTVFGLFMYCVDTSDMPMMIEGSWVSVGVCRRPTYS